MRSLLQPDLYVASVQQVDLEALLKRGIRAVLIDLDNTLVGWSSSDFGPEVAAWFVKAREAGLKLCILSNTAGRSRIEAIGAALGVPHVMHARKPRRGAFRRAMEMLGVRPSETAVIGDQLFTDVLGGNRLGLHTILCVPLPGRECPGMMWVRMAERHLLRSLGHKRPAAESAIQGTESPQEA